jgi:hypothetical protein
MTQTPKRLFILLKLFVQIRTRLMRAVIEFLVFADEEVTGVALGSRYARQKNTSQSRNHKQCLRKKSKISGPPCQDAPAKAKTQERRNRNSHA